MTLVDKIADTIQAECKWLSAGDCLNIATQVEKLILSDPSIVEIEPDVELPIDNSDVEAGLARSMAAAYPCTAMEQDVLTKQKVADALASYKKRIKKAGWVKRKDGGVK